MMFMFWLSHLKHSVRMVLINHPKYVHIELPCCDVTDELVSYVLPVGVMYVYMVLVSLPGQLWSGRSWVCHHTTSTDHNEIRDREDCSGHSVQGERISQCAHSRYVIHYYSIFVIFTWSGSYSFLLNKQLTIWLRKSSLSCQCLFNKTVH